MCLAGTSLCLFCQSVTRNNVKTVHTMQPGPNLQPLKKLAEGLNDDLSSNM